MKFHTNSIRLNSGEYGRHLMGENFPSVSPRIVWPAMWGGEISCIICSQGSRKTSLPISNTTLSKKPAAMVNPHSFSRNRLSTFSCPKKELQNINPTLLRVFLVTHVLLCDSSIWKANLAWEDLNLKIFKNSVDLCRGPTIAMPTVKSLVLIGLENSQPILLSPMNMIRGEIESYLFYIRQ